MSINRIDLIKSIKFCNPWVLCGRKILDVIKRCSQNIKSRNHKTCLILPDSISYTFQEVWRFTDNLLTVFISG